MNEEMKAMMEELKAMKDSMAAKPAAEQTGVLSGWSKPKPVLGQVNVEKVLVPVELGTADGNVTVYFQLDGAIANAPDTLLGTVEGMQAAGIPVKSWKPKQSTGWKR